MSSQGVFRFVLTDVTSRGNLVTVSIAPADLALAMTGRADLPCSFESSPRAFANVGMKRIDRSVGIDHAEASTRAREFHYLKRDHPHRGPLVEAFNRWALFEAVKALPADDQRIPADDWSLAINGTGSKQDGGSWKVTICRFEEIEKES